MIRFGVLIPPLDIRSVCCALGLALWTALSASPAVAQNAAAVTDGTNFAKSIAPSSATQLVNPNGVNSTAWAGSTATPTTVPAGLGTFSTPNVSSTPLNSAQSMGLAGYGNQAVVNCANYNAATGDATQALTCAAVNFLTNQCLSPTTQQQAIMAANATSPTTPAGNCSGTYGQAQANYGFSEAETSSDPIFSNVSNLASTAPAVAGNTCSVQTVVVTPAQYANYTCSKNDSSNSYTCYQYLNTAVNTTYTPATPAESCTAPAVLENGYCVSQTSSPAPVIYGCPPGETVSGSSCISTSTAPATPVYTCPTGFTLNGTTCTESNTTGEIRSQSCPAVAGTTSSGYNAGTIDGVTGYCTYVFSSVTQPNAQAQCQAEFPAPVNGASLFYVTQTSRSLGRELEYINSCYVTPPLTCPTGYTWNGTACQEQVTQTATLTGYTCSTGVLTGTSCVVTTTSPGTPTYQCPPGEALSGTQCVTTIDSPPTVTYSCPNDSAPVGNQCITNYVLTSWVDTCGTYETSAGITLPTPP